MLTKPVRSVAPSRVVVREDPWSIRDAAALCPGLSADGEHLSEPEIHIDLLHRLLEAEGPMAVMALGDPASVPGRLSLLRDAGCVIDGHPQHGVRLVAAGLGCWADYIESRHAGRLGRSVRVYQQTTSTQQVARQLVEINAAPHHGTVVAADHQAAGRGRRGRQWFAPPGAALLTTVIADPRGASADRLVLASCCALAEAVESLTDARVQVRWPNDLLIDGDKLAGILVEAVNGAALIGVGVNVSVDPADLPRADGDRAVHATSLAARGYAVDRLRLLDRLLDRLDHALYHADDELLRRYWYERSCLLQQRVTVDSDGTRLTGRVIDLDPRDGLLLEVERGPVVTLRAETTSLVFD
ncbi:MAG: biotin--[acetyl-CoA-carboxylase] ligase [Phycisphaera sp.]|nr:biotin--[acetyl-CoA-carboxylase] ligase [Phycisphaera sp.]